MLSFIFIHLYLILCRQNVYTQIKQKKREKEREGGRGRERERFGYSCLDLLMHLSISWGLCSRLGTSELALALLERLASCISHSSPGISGLAQEYPSHRDSGCTSKQVQSDKHFFKCLLVSHQLTSHWLKS